MIRETGGAGHIANLGHGILPGARLDCVEAFFETARQPLPRAAAAKEMVV
jgi:uroporphyrinogen-III decarboxylase